jgi:hypothetical protein
MGAVQGVRRELLPDGNPLDGITDHGIKPHAKEVLFARVLETEQIGQPCLPFCPSQSTLVDSFPRQVACPEEVDDAEERPPDQSR